MWRSPLGGLSLDRRRKILWRMLGVTGLAVLWLDHVSLSVDRAPSAYPFPVTMLCGCGVFVLYLCRRHGQERSMRVG
jgi:hypothetical protein